jgi:hypothetical protein
MNVSVTLIDKPLRELRNWEVFFHKNLLASVHGHAGRDRVQICALCGCIELSKRKAGAEGHHLEALFGDKSVPIMFLPGDTVVQFVHVEYR